ncbi:MAG: right-handed parallel beta-helix repeat-containing protein [Anaerolineales bacterium]
MNARRIALVLLLLLFAMTGVGISNAQAAGLCVHPKGAGNCFTTIQAAVDAANDGDTILIRTGKYVEQVTILDKDLSLIGANGVIVQAPLGMQDTMSAVAGVEGRPIILAANADVTLRNLTIDGFNSADANPYLDGITFVSAGGVIRDNVIKNVSFADPQPVYQGNGIVVANQMATPRTIVISGNRITKFNSVGITVFAETDPMSPAESTLTAHILNNQIVAQGENSVIDQWGIFLGGYSFATPQTSVTGTIKGNRVRDALMSAPYMLPGVGIVTMYTHDVVVKDNAVENSNVGVAANLSFTSQIKGNKIIGPQAMGTGSTGLIFSGSDSSIAENEFQKLDLGLMLVVDDPLFGSATNTALDGNKFEKVAMDMLTGAVNSSMSTFSTQAVPEQAERRFGPR